MTKGSALRAQDQRLRKVAACGPALDTVQVSRALESILSTMRGDRSAEHLVVHQHVSDLIHSIEFLRTEIRNLEPNKICQEHIPTASSELEAIVLATEDATNRIMSAAEAVERVAGALEGAPSAELTDVATMIYEAGTFQDITGQRVKKVMSTLQHIESSVGAIVNRLELGDGVPTPAPTPEAADLEAALLNGPSLPGDSKSQADMDALFAS